MKRKRILNAALILAIGIQLIPIDRENPPIASDFDGPEKVKAIFKRSCYDCHSNEVQWPWYGYIAPISWLVAHDIDEGREELNFSDWQRHHDDEHMMEEIYEEVAEGEMPMTLYLVTHPGARVSDEEKSTLKAWAGE